MLNCRPDAYTPPPTSTIVLKLSKSNSHEHIRQKWQLQLVESERSCTIHFLYLFVLWFTYLSKGKPHLYQLYSLSRIGQSLGPGRARFCVWRSDSYASITCGLIGRACGDCGGSSQGTSETRTHIFFVGNFKKIGELYPAPEITAKHFPGDSTNNSAYIIYK